MPRVARWIVVYVLVGCQQSLPHDGPFDPASPVERQARGRVTGRITLEGESDFSQVTVLLRDRAKRRSYESATLNDGTFEFLGVVPGNYELIASARYFQAWRQNITVLAGETIALDSFALALNMGNVRGTAQAQWLQGREFRLTGGVAVTAMKVGSIRAGQAAASHYVSAATAVSASLPQVTTISGPDGTYTFALPAGYWQLRFTKDDLSQESPVITVTAEGDELVVAPVTLRPLTGFFKIRGIAKDEPSYSLTATAAVVLEISGFNAARMRIGSSPDGRAESCALGSASILNALQPYLLTRQGVNYVCLALVSDDGRETAPAVESITYDATPPLFPSLRVNEGVAFTRSPQVSLELSAFDATSGVEKMVIARDAGFTNAVAEDFVPLKVYPLTQGDGAYTLFVRFIDKAGNASSPVSSTVVLDRTAPAAQLSVPGGSLVNSNLLPVRIDADGDTEAMQLTNDPLFATVAWQPVQPWVMWIFPPFQGPVTMYARFRDVAGNESGVFSLTVTIDTLPPTIASVTGAVGSETLVWDDFAPDATGYTVRLFDQGSLVAATFTTAKRLSVGKMHPGFTVVTHFADGSESAPSYPPGYAVPPTVEGYIGLGLGNASNQLLQRLLNQYALGTTTSGCAQVLVQSSDVWDEQRLDCSGSVLRFTPIDKWNYSVPPFQPSASLIEGNPLVGLSYPLWISGTTVGYIGTMGGTVLLSVPSNLQWPGTRSLQAEAGQPIAVGRRFNPGLGRGENQIDFAVPFAALARTDDAIVSSATDTTLSVLPPLAQGLYTIPSGGRIAGIDASSVRFAQFGWESFLILNDLWSGGNDFTRSMWLEPGSARLPYYLANGEIAGGVVRVADTWYDCYGGCVTYGMEYVLDTTAATFSRTHRQPWWWGAGYTDALILSNASGTRAHHVPALPNARTTLYWREEWDQPTIEEFLRRSIHYVSAPVRVRGTGRPVLRSSVPDASAMQWSTSGDFTQADWQPYASVITLPEGVAEIWVRYRDGAGNISEPRRVQISAPVAAPQLRAAVLIGPRSNPGYTTVRDVTAYLAGYFGPDTLARVSTSPTFADEGWTALPPPVRRVVLTNPFTGKPDVYDSENGLVVTTLPLRLPEQPGRYVYWFWLSDSSRNYSLPVSAQVLFDTTAPQAEFSLKPELPNSMLFQARWTVTRTQWLPPLSSAVPTTQTMYALPFTFSYLGESSQTLQLSTDQDACISVGRFNACAWLRMPQLPSRSIAISAQQATVIWRTVDPYGTPLTAAVTLLPNGVARLSYWDTRGRIHMAGHVDGVETPYSDWHYALARGSVEYTPNPPAVFVLKNARGSTYLVSATANYRGSAWMSVAITDTGRNQFEGTAFSQAGAVGRVTSRFVTIPQAGADDIANLQAYPLSDGRALLEWDLPRNTDMALARMEGEIISPYASVGVTSGTGLTLATAEVPEWMGGQSRVTVRSSLRPIVDTWLPSSGAFLKVDPLNQLLYGNDGSIWDIANPAAPQPIRVFGGSYPFREGTVARSGPWLWTPVGVFNITNPESPVRLADSPGTANEVYHFAFQGRIFKPYWGTITYYSEDNPSQVGTPIGIGYSVDPATIVQVGGILYGLEYPRLIAIDIRDPLNLTAWDTGISASMWSQGVHFNGGNWVLTQGRVVGAGLLLLIDQVYGWLPALTNPSVSSDLWPIEPWQASMGNGPWAYAATPGGFTTAHFGQSVPGPYQTAVFSNATFSLDRNYVYVCAPGDGLRAYDRNWQLRAQNSNVACDSYNQLVAVSPYIFVDRDRYVVSGDRIVMADRLGCPPGQRTDPFCQATWRGGVFEGSDGKLYFGFGHVVPLSEPCRVLGVDEDRLYCQADSAPNSISATTLSSLRYAGITAGELTLPLVRLEGVTGSFVSSGGGYLATTSGLYRIENLARAVGISGPPSLQILKGGLAADAEGNVYRLLGSRATRVLRLPGNISWGKTQMSADGTFVRSDSNQAVLVRWGPAAPELRIRATLNNPQAIAVSKGAVYVADADGLALLEPLRRYARLVDRSDITVRHEPGQWLVLDRHLRPVTTVSETPGMTTNELCARLKVRTVIPDVPPRVVEDVCIVEVSAPAQQILLGDLGRDWLGWPGLRRDPIGPIGAFAVDSSGRVFAASENLGIRVYEPGTTNASATFGPAARSVAVDDANVYLVSMDGNLSVYENRVGFPVRGTINTGGVADRVLANGQVVGYQDSSGGFTRIDPVSLTQGSTCWIGGAGVALTTQRWGGNVHPMLLTAGWDSVTRWALDSCAGTDFIRVPEVRQGRISLDSGFGLIETGDGGLAVVPAQLGPTPTITYLYGDQPMHSGVFNGTFVYAIGPNGLQVFQLH